MMAVIGDDPVLWVDTRTTKERGHYASEHMRLFNQALEKAHARYPALHVYEWSADARDEWFQRDGIHFTAEGYEHRAELIADALADGLPGRRRPPTDGLPSGVDPRRWPPRPGRRPMRCARRAPGWR